MAGLAAVFAQFPILEVHVSGNQRLPADAIIAASGLRLDQTASPKDFDAAVERLIATGLFRSATYRYDPKNNGRSDGFSVTLAVVEEPAVRPVQLDIPDTDERALWQQLKAADALVTEAMPDNEPAAAYYARVVEGVLAKSNRHEKIIVKSEVDLRTGRMVAIFRPADLAKIGALRFTGVHALPEPTLQAALQKVAAGEEYTERDFRRLLELNVRPIYEEKGHLTVAFPRVSAAPLSGNSVAVTTEIEEGSAWSLGKVYLKGEDLPTERMSKAARFPLGKPANWAEIRASIESMAGVLQNDGYLRASLRPVRAFHTENNVVDITVEVDKGKQSFFGELKVEGLDPADTQRAFKSWKMKSGAPLNAGYVNEYLHDLFDILKSRPKTVSQALHPRPGSNVVDVTLTFK